MPLVHREDFADQERAVSFFETLGLPDNLRSAQRASPDIIARFGRFPHRNEVLAPRDDGKQERIYLEDGGFSG